MHLEEGGINAGDMVMHEDGPQERSLMTTPKSQAVLLFYEVQLQASHSHVKLLPLILQGMTGQVPEPSGELISLLIKVSTTD